MRIHFIAIATMAVFCSSVAVAVPTTNPVNVEIDGSKTYEISPLIYGANFPDWKTMAGRITLTRWGGNRTTAYNWETNASNAGADYHHQNDDFMGKSDVPGDSIAKYLAAAQEAGAVAIVSIPCIGYVSADKLGDGDVNQTPDYLHKRFKASRATKGLSFSYPPDASDDFVNQDECVAWIEKNYAAKKPIFYALDNEPDIWSSTHARLHPKPITYDELVKINIEYASAIKDVAPQAQVIGFCSYGWGGWHTLQMAPDRNGRDFLEFYCQEMHKAEQKAGKRLIDAIDLHYYPEARGGGLRITEDKQSPEINAARIQAPRSLWDRTYEEDSWIVRDALHKPMAELRRVNETIARNYPGTKLAICEYDFGGGDHISGAIAQADVLGIFGREGVYAATIWRQLQADDYIYGAFRAYRDYDGNGSAFGSTGLAVSSDSDPANSSVYASRDDAGRLVVVAINKCDATMPVTIKLKGASMVGPASIYGIEAGHPAPKPAGTKNVTNDSLSVDLAPMSVTTIVVGKRL